jgi:hypothetical protein
MSSVDKLETALLRMRTASRDLVVFVVVGLTVMTGAFAYLLLTHSHLPSPF